jgi:hypothetical protein
LLDHLGDLIHASLKSVGQRAQFFTSQNLTIEARKPTAHRSTVEIVLKIIASRLPE